MLMVTWPFSWSELVAKCKEGQGKLKRQMKCYKAGNYFFSTKSSCFEMRVLRRTKHPSKTTKVLEDKYNKVEHIRSKDL